MNYLILYCFFRQMAKAKICEPIGVPEIMQNISTSIHDDPINDYSSFELLSDDEINNDFLRDAIEIYCTIFTILNTREM